jgi:SAM-dependent methyltransferase
MTSAADKLSLPFVLRWLRKNVGKKGLVGLTDFAISFLSDYWFDYRYATSTHGWIPSDQLNSNCENRQHAVRYQPTKGRPFGKLMRQLRFPEVTVFVDIGSGKGKVLLMASRHGFKKLIGIEFDTDLCKIARENIAIFRTKTGVCINAEVVEADIVEYKITDDENVFYLYNPFDDFILGRFLDNVEASLRSKPRKIWLIYHIPKHADVIQKHNIFTRSQEYLIGGTEFIVYMSE